MNTAIVNATEYRDLPFAMLTEAEQERQRKEQATPTRPASASSLL